MKLPAGEAAIVDRQKLVDYGLNPEHPRGKHKATAVVRSLWIVRRGETAPRLTSCFVK
ncbi:MAG: DUF6883 domain-containing protein [Vicinamibacterales bacterium]